MTGLLSTKFVIRQIRLSANSLKTSTLLTLEECFWTKHAEFYNKVELGALAGKSLEELQYSDVQQLEQYLDFFNLLGVLGRSGALSFEEILEVYPYRLYRVLELQCVKGILNNFGDAWTGICYLKDKHDNLPKLKVEQLRNIERFKKDRRMSNSTSINAKPMPIDDAPQLTPGMGEIPPYDSSPAMVKSDPQSSQPITEHS